MQLKKTVFFSILTLALSTPAYAVDKLGDAEAKNIAEKMLDTLVSARAEFDKSFNQTGNGEDYLIKVVKPLNKAISEWPKQHQDNRAIFPYFACHQAAIDLKQYTDEKVYPKPGSDGTWLNHVAKNYRNDLAACKSSIQKPDLSLKNIQ